MVLVMPTLPPVGSAAYAIPCLPSELLSSGCPRLPVGRPHSASASAGDTTCAVGRVSLRCPSTTSSVLPLAYASSLRPIIVLLVFTTSKLSTTIHVCGHCEQMPACRRPMATRKPDRHGSPRRTRLWLPPRHHGPADAGCRLGQCRRAMIGSLPRARLRLPCIDNLNDRLQVVRGSEDWALPQWTRRSTRRAVVPVSCRRPLAGRRVSSVEGSRREPRRHASTGTPKRLVWCR